LERLASVSAQKISPPEEEGCRKLGDREPSLILALARSDREPGMMAGLQEADFALDRRRQAARSDRLTLLDGTPDLQSFCAHSFDYFIVRTN
jgi:hypothetical protein